MAVSDSMTAIVNQIIVVVPELFYDGFLIIKMSRFLYFLYLYKIVMLQRIYVPFYYQKSETFKVSRLFLTGLRFFVSLVI